MKLFLSSLRPPVKTELTKLIGKRKNYSVVVVPNAWDVNSNQKEFEVKSCINDFKNFGFEVEILDLTKTKAALIKNFLTDKDLVWVMGGNTFYLNYWMRQSGFSDVIKGLLKNGLVYGGESAGAVVVGKTLHGIENLDDPKESPEVLWDGLKLFNYSIIPHWDSEKDSDYLLKVKSEMEKYSLVATMTDRQAFVVEGEELELIEI